MVYVDVREKKNKKKEKQTFDVDDEYDDVDEEKSNAMNKINCFFSHLYIYTLLRERDNVSYQ